MSKRPADGVSTAAAVAEILVVDDERPIRRFLRVALGSAGYGVVEADSVASALQQAVATRPDLVILDLGLPDGDGVEIIRRLREWTEIPIIVLSVRGQERDKIEALDAGADDYLTKPFGTGELLARIRVALRRMARAPNDPVIQVRDLVIDLARRRVAVGGREVHLTATEYAVLRTLALHAGKVLTHKQLLKAVWGPGYEEATHLLRVNMSNLRRKVEPNPLKPQYLITEPGVGYRLREGS